MTQGDFAMITTEFDKILLTDRDLESLGFGSAKARRNRRCRGEDPIPHIRVGRLVRYHIKDLEEYMAKNRVEKGGG